MSYSEKRFLSLSLILAVVISFFLLLMIIIINSEMTNSTLLEMRFYYSGAEARDHLSQLSPHDSDTYRTLAGIDLFFIAAYTVATCYFIKIYFSGAFLWLGIIPGFIDLIETVGILFALRTQPLQNYFDFLGLVTAAKWTIVVLLFLVIIALLVHRWTRPSRGLSVSKS